MTQTRNSQWGVRAGEARADFLQTGYAEHKRVPGLFGFSVQFAPGKSVEELAWAGRFRNATISYADLSDLQTAVAALSYRADVIASPGIGYHHTFVVLYDTSNVLLTQLPRPVAEAISNTFTRITNPHRVQCCHPRIERFQMYHIPVDFNSMMRDPEERVELARVGSWQAERLPALAAGDEVIVYDEEMEVHGTIEFDTKHHLWLVRPDWTTRRDIHSETLSERDQAPARSHHE